MIIVMMEVPKQFQGIVKPLVFTVSLIPLLLLGGKALTHGLGANPVQKVLHQTGDWSLNFLMITLFIRPAGELTGFSALMRFRRMMGLFSFFYASLHFVAYIGLEHFFDWVFILEDVLRHKRIIVGFAGYVLLVPLAVTSTQGMIRKLGFPKWQRLHRLVYGSALCGVLHYLFLTKADTRRPLIYGAIFSSLLVLRIISPWVKRERGRE